jgi:hypothetical protein
VKAPDKIDLLHIAEVCLAGGFFICHEYSVRTDRSLRQSLTAGGLFYVRFYLGMLHRRVSVISRIFEVSPQQKFEIQGDYDMSDITRQDNYEEFTKECKFFYCQYIYEGDWDGKEKYIVASDTPEEELMKKYPSIMKRLSPYVFCNAACGKVFSESKNNIDKFYRRSNENVTYDEGDFADVPDNQSFEDRLMKALVVEQALELCTPIQKERLVKHYGEGVTLRELSEGSSHSSVKESIEAGIKRIRKKFA